MNQNIEQAKELMEQGWKAREELKFDKAESLLESARKLFEEAGDWFNVTECLNHLAYTSKLRATKEFDLGLSRAEEAKNISQKESTKKESILRVQISLLCLSGKYEEALSVAQELLNNYSKSANQADIMQHIAMIKLRTGHLDKALETINIACKLIEEGWEQEGDPHRSIWKTGILITKGLILYNLDQIDPARATAEEALRMAKEQNLKTRVTQAENLLDLLI